MARHDAPSSRPRQMTPIYAPDMDLCYISPPGQPMRSASELVEMLGKTIEQEAPNQFIVKMLPRARIPIIKLQYLPNPATGNTQGISCDIGFENRLALENTRLLLTYAMADPRLRTIVLFRECRSQMIELVRSKLSIWALLILFALTSR